MAVPSPNGIETGISLSHLFPHTCMGMTTQAIERKNPGTQSEGCPDRIRWLPVVDAYRTVVALPSPERNTGYCILSIKEFLRDASSDS